MFIYIIEVISLLYLYSIGTVATTPRFGDSTIPSLDIQYHDKIYLIIFNRSNEHVRL